MKMCIDTLEDRNLNMKPYFHEYPTRECEGAKKNASPSLLRVSLLFLLFLAVTSIANGTAPDAPTGLRTNYATNPVGIDTSKPLFSWLVNDSDRDEVQTAYQLIVSSEKGEAWDTGKVRSSNQNDIVYAGPALASRDIRRWKVRTWDKNDQVSPWSAPASFELAFLHKSDWTANWIGGDYERYRTLATLPEGKRIAQARAYISAKEMFDLNINGARIGGDRVLEPGFSRFDVRMRYCTYDVTSNLRAGANVMLVALGNGHLQHFYFKSSAREFLLQIEVLFWDGTMERIISDSKNWKGTRSGPVVPPLPTKSELYQGVTYDARNEDGAATPGYDDRDWTPIQTARPAASGLLLVAQSTRPTKATQLVTPIAMTQPLPGVYVFDMGRRINGWSKLTVQGPRGATVVLKHGEKLYTPDSWADYTFALNATIVREAAGIRFRIADDDNYYLWQLSAYKGLVAQKKVKGAWTEIKKVAVPLKEGTAYAVKIQMAGSTITTSIDGKLVDTTEDLTFRSGKVGFYQKGEQTASFDHIVVAPASQWDYSSRSPYAIKSGCSDEGLWINRENLATTKPAGDKKGINRVFTLKNNERMMSYDGGVTGQVDQSNLHVFSSFHFADATDRYTLKGGSTETWEPRFTSHGFRYVEVHGFPGIPTLESVKGRVAHQSLDENPGSFTCSNDLLNKLHQACTNTYLNCAQHGMPVDCDQRDERMGWTGDSHLSAPAACYNFDVINFYDSWMDDLMDTQAPNGSVYNIAPTLNPAHIGTCKSTTWTATYILTPWEVYVATGSKEFLRKRYPSMKAYADWLATDKVLDYIDSKDQYGDWAAPVIGSAHEIRTTATRSELLATPFLYRCITLQAKIASELGIAQDAAHYADLARKIQASFNGKFLVDGAYRDGKPVDKQPKGITTQTGNSLGLGLGICPPEARPLVTQTLVDQITQNNGHHATGGLGVKCLLGALCENGREDVAYQLATDTGYPSWGKWIKDGLTSTCEFWDGSKSQSHHWLQGPLDSYFYKYLAGIFPTKPGYEEFTVKPHIKNDLTNVSATVQTVRGKVAVIWSKPAAKQFTLQVTVPVNARATVYVPTNGKAPAKAILSESGTPIWERGVAAKNRPDIDVQRTEGDCIVLRIGSGSYSFVLK